MPWEMPPVYLKGADLAALKLERDDLRNRLRSLDIDYRRLCGDYDELRDQYNDRVDELKDVRGQLEARDKEEEGGKRKRSRNDDGGTTAPYEAGPTSSRLSPASQLPAMRPVEDDEYDSSQGDYMDIDRGSFPTPVEAYGVSAPVGAQTTMPAIRRAAPVNYQTPLGSVDHVRLPGGAHLSAVDHTLRFGRKAQRAAENERMGLPPPRMGMPAGGTGMPVSAGELEAWIAAANVPGNEFALQRMKTFVAVCQQIADANCTDVMRSAMTQWRLPTWAKAKQAAVTAKYAVGKGPKPVKVPNPNYGDPAVNWAAWLYRNRATIVNNGRPQYPGTVVVPGGVSLTHIRGMNIVMPRAPKRVTDVSSSRNRHRFLQLACELMGTINLYRNMLQSLGRSVAEVETVERFSQPLDNVTMEDIATFFAEQGVSVEQFVDAQPFGVEWLQDYRGAHTEDPEASAVFTRMTTYAATQNDWTQATLPGEPTWWYPPPRHYNNGPVAGPSGASTMSTPAIAGPSTGGPVVTTRTPLTVEHQLTAGVRAALDYGSSGAGPSGSGAGPSGSATIPAASATAAATAPIPGLGAGVGSTSMGPPVEAGGPSDQTPGGDGDMPDDPMDGSASGRAASGLEDGEVEGAA